MADSSYEELSSFDQENMDSETEEIQSTRPKRRRGKARIWIKEKEFETADLALKAVKDEVSELNILQ